MGALDLLPAHTARLLKEIDEQTSDIDGMSVNVAIGYSGRRESNNTHEHLKAVKSDGLHCGSPVDLGGGA